MATLLEVEGVNTEFFKVMFKKYILFKNGCFKAVKLVKNVIIVISKCLRTSFREKIRQLTSILAKISDYIFLKNELLLTFSARRNIDSLYVLEMKERNLVCRANRLLLVKCYDNKKV